MVPWAGEQEERTTVQFDTFETTPMRPSVKSLISQSQRGLPVDQRIRQARGRPVRIGRQTWNRLNLSQPSAEPAEPAAPGAKIFAQFADDMALARCDDAVAGGAMLKPVQSLRPFLAEFVMAGFIGVAVALPRFGAGGNGTQRDEGGGEGKKLHCVVSPRCKTCRNNKRLRVVKHRLR